jgi:hypothetical protein
MLKSLSILPLWQTDMKNKMIIRWVLDDVTPLEYHLRIISLSPTNMVVLAGPDHLKADS